MNATSRSGTTPRHLTAPLSSPLTWMTHIVRNRCIDWLRSGYARQFHADEAWLDDLSSTPGDVSLDEQHDREVLPACTTVCSI